MKLVHKTSAPFAQGTLSYLEIEKREEYLEDQRRQRDLAAESRRQAKLQKEQRALEKKQRKELEENEKQQSLLLQERQRQQKLKQSHPATPVVARSSVKEGVGDRKRRCPFCAEEILAAAAKCKHCGEFLDGHRESRHGSERMIVVEKEGGGGCGTIVTIALGIVLAVIILAFL